MKSEEIRRRLQGDQPATKRLVELLVEDALATPLRELVAPLQTAKAVVDGLRAWLASDAGEETLLAWGERGRAWARAQGMSVGELTGRAIEDACLDLAARPVAPNRDLLLSVLDREPMRLLLRELFMDALLNFGRKIRAPVASNPLAKGLGGIGRMARDRAKATTFGAIASEMADRVSDEVEKQVERRAVDFADAALEGLMHKLVDLLSHPSRAQSQAALREAIVEGLFALGSHDIAEELERDDPRERSRIIRRGLGLWATSDEAIERVRDLLEGLVAHAAERTLAEALDELGLLETYRGLATESVRARLEPFLAGDAFATWLNELLEGEEEP